jgi:hypothetical protein
MMHEPSLISFEQGTGDPNVAKKQHSLDVIDRVFIEPPHQASSWEARHNRFCMSNGVQPNQSADSAGFSVVSGDDAGLT